ncbi:MAG: zinc-ribbon domain-containing protein [Clostridiaceae bacterium]|nr:zinc-ribbon domain-containing protein [Clostridiaceae bacterium]
MMLDTTPVTPEESNDSTQSCELFDNYPQARDAWDYTLNVINPEQVKPLSAKKIHWRCKEGHSFLSQVRYFISANNPCPECRRLSESVAGKPHMMKFWDFEKNTMDADKISAKSKDIAYWKCDKCGYEWQSTIRSRQNDQCPCCESNMAIAKGINDFSTVYPLLGKDALQELNPDIDLGLEGVGSHKRILWRCHVCSHEWKAPIYGRIRRDTRDYYITKCPVCAKNKRGITLDKEFPALVKLYSKNNPKLLSQLRGDWKQKHIWVCDAHGEFTATLSSMIRALRTGNTGCPYCHGTKVKREESFGALHPDLVAEWSPRNEISPYDVTEHSKKEVEWKCDKGHTWSAMVHPRAVGFYYCRECYPFGKNSKSFAEVYPELEKYYSPKNKSSFHSHSQRDASYATWTCEKGHSFIDSFKTIDSRGFKCKVCDGSVIESGYNDFMHLYPDFAKGYDETKNELPANKISPKNSDMNTYWTCEKGHSFQRSVRTHVANKGVCPVCAKYILVLGENDLLSEYPQIDEIWDYDQNERGPQEIFSINPNRHSFVCDKDHHYKATIKQVIDNNFSCLVCNNVKFDSTVNSLAVLNPELAKEWSCNNDRGADTVRPTDRMTALWECPVCEGEYKAPIYIREVDDESCPYCANKKFKPGLNDLCSTHPELASEWSPNNDKGPEQYWKKSDEYVKWKCHICHGEYSSCIRNREYNDESCPYCYHGRLLVGFNDLATTHPELAEEWSPNNEFGPDSVRKTSYTSVKWICPDCNQEYSTGVINRSVGDDSCPYCNRKAVAPGINDLATINPLLAAEWSPKNKRTPDSVRCDSRLDAFWECPDCKGVYNEIIDDREVGDESCPFCSKGKLLAGLNDLATTHPELAAEWSPRNEKPASAVKKEYRYHALWVCPDCGNDYRTSVSEREVGDKRCYYCYGSYVKKGYNDLATTHPELVKEWSPNNEKTPNVVRKSHCYTALWTCPKCNGEYSYRIMDREIGDDSCPVCADKKVLRGYNDLATVAPLLALEWSPNNKRTIYDVRRSLRVDALWTCPKCNGEYQFRIADREVGDDACPVCADRKVLPGYNDLSTTHPELVKEWSSKNDRTPETVRKSNAIPAWWTCSTCNGEYQYRIADREVGDNACPYCSDKKVIPGYNSFLVVHKELMSEWLHVENTLIGINPDFVLHCDRKVAWWKCNECNMKYMQSIFNKQLKQKRGHSSCPRCNGRRTKQVHYI